VQKHSLVNAEAKSMHTRWKERFVILLWPLLGLLGGIFAWTYVLTNLNNERRTTEERTLRDTATLARNYAALTSRFLKNIDQLGLHVQFEYELTAQGLDLSTFDQRGLFTDEPLINVTIVDSDGRPISSTHPYDSNVSLKNDPSFVLHKNGAADSLYISGPGVSRLFQFPTINFSRNLRDAQSKFAGVVIVSVSPSYFTDSYDVATLKEHGLLILTDERHRLLAARTGRAGVHDGNVGMHMNNEFAGSNGVVLIPGSKFDDERERYVGWQRIDEYNVIAIAGLDRQEALAPYVSSKAYVLQYMKWGTGILTLGTLIATYMAYRLQLRKTQIEEVRSTYRLATERGNEGFYMLRPKYARDRNAIDFTFVDCNRRGAEMYGMSHDQLLGKDLSTLLPATIFADEMNKLQEALDHGYLEEELKITDGMPIQCEWLNRRIVRSRNGLAVTVSDISERKAHVRELQRKGYEDALTGLHNRHWLSEFLPKAIAQAEAEGYEVALMFVDLDRFKRVNDAMGHAIGDELLRRCAERLVDAVRPGDKVARLGGDEFLILLSHVDGKEGTQRVAERISAAISERFRLTASILDIHASIGISLFPHDGTDAETLLNQADIAMYSAKTGGRGQWRFYDPRFDEEVKNRLRRERELVRAIEEDEFTVYYQPRLEMQSRKVCSMEALVRWEHPIRGTISPTEFIPLAEETGQIIELGQLVIKKVFSQMAQWGARGEELIPVSINVSAKQFNETDIRAILSDAFAEHPVTPNLIEVELTESSMTGDVADIRRTIASIQKMGVKVLVDDFGTGYSSLAQLQKLDMDVLKVDRAFTLEIDRGDEGKIFFSAIITMAHALGMRVVAEGVENATQVNILNDLDCDEIQGYFVSRPLAANALQEFLQRMKSPHASAKASRVEK
jgi:diguanylate cyclase (GGDEF)-like protein/PAS domain S-box-containing protein